MTLTVDIARIAIVVNLLVLAGLLYVWGQTYRELGSKHSLGLLIFGVFLFAENGLALYFYFQHPVLKVWVDSIPDIAQLAMTALRVLETGGLLFLAWVSWD